MIKINPNNQTERENYKILTATILPRPIAFVTSINSKGLVNAAPFSYFNIVSSNPPLISLAIQRRDGLMKDTARNILNEKSFVVHIVDSENVKEINKTARSLGPNESEIELTSLSLLKSSLINVPGIKEAKVRMECILEKYVPLENNSNITTDLIIGRIVQFHLDDEIYVEGNIIVSKLKAVSRLEAHNYATIGDVFTIKRPK